MRRLLLSHQYVSDSSSNYYSVNLHEEWQISSISNPNSLSYDGVYESFSNYNVGNGVAKMMITINNLDEFTLYIRSYAETYYDYIMVSQLDVDIDGNTSYQYNAAVKAHTRTTQNSGTDIYSYTPVRYENIGGGEHTITILYKKDSSGNSYDDRGYVLIDKNFKVYNENSGGDSSESTQMDPNNYMTIEALEDGLSVMLNANSLEYCIDGDGNWISLPAGSYTQSINTGQKLHFRGNDLSPVANSGIGTFTITKACNLSGNCNSLLFGDQAASNFSLAEYSYAFYKLFYNCTTIKSIYDSFLPARALANYCYGYMFYGCTNLTSTTNLPALTLVGSCYYYMYYGCTSLTNPGTISATTLATYCCYGMYYKCSSLVVAPDLLATELKSYCYYYMFSGCSSLNKIKMLGISTSGNYYCLYYWMNGVPSSGAFIKNKDATWSDVGASGVPNGWIIELI